MVQAQGKEGGFRMVTNKRDQEVDTLLEQTDLSRPQINLLLTMSDFLVFAESVSQQEIHIFVRAENGFLAIKDGRKGRRIEAWPASTMSLWDNLFTEGQVLADITTYYDKDEYMIVYPIVDNGGKIIGGLSFTNPRIDSQSYKGRIERNRILTESIYQLIMVAQDSGQDVYQPISYQDGVIIFDDTGLILYANEASNRLVNLLGFDRRLVGSSIYGSTLKLSFLKALIDNHKADICQEIYQDMIIRQTVIPISYGRGQGRNFLFLKDMTVEAKVQQDLLVKNSVIKEIHHRVKNNLQTVAGLLRMEARRSDLPEVRKALQESISRIESMALVHDIVSHYDEDYISVRSIFDELGRLLRSSLMNQQERVELVYQGDEEVISSHKAGYVSLIINELITNSLEHGFSDKQEEALISLTVEDRPDQILLDYRDTGRGFPQDFDLGQSKRLGLQIISNLVTHELKGTLDLSNNPQGGVRIQITMSKD